MDAAAPDLRGAGAASDSTPQTPDAALAARFAEFGLGDAALADLALWRDMLADWSGRMNLVGPKELPQFWTRHALDCAQLLPLAPLSGRWLDLGSGAGFPGVAIAIAQKHAGGGETTLVESVGKKSGFLRAVAERLGLPGRVVAGRFEDMAPERFDVITARAFAPLPRLFPAAHRFWGQSTIGLFPKGKGIDTEAPEAERAWRFRAERVPSITGDGAILRVTELSRK